MRNNIASQKLMITIQSNAFTFANMIITEGNLQLSVTPQHSET